VGLGQGGGVDFVDGAGLIAVAHAHMACLAAQAAAVAVGAAAQAAQAGQVVAHDLRIAFAQAPRHVGDDTFEHMLHHGGLAVAVVGEGQLLGAGTPQHDLAHGGRPAVERRLHILAIVLRNALQQAEVGAVAPVPTVDGAVGQADGRKGHDLVRVELLADA